MTESAWRVLEEYVRATANLMGLRDWTFQIDCQPCDEGIAGQIRCTEGTKFASIMVAADFQDRPMKEQKVIVAHELMHCHTAAMAYTTNMIKGLLQRDVWDLFSKAFEMQLEHCVDAVGVAIADQLPAIEWPTESESDG